MAHEITLSLGADGDGAVTLDGAPLDCVSVALESDPERGTLVHLVIRAAVVPQETPRPAPQNQRGFQSLNPK